MPPTDRELMQQPQRTHWEGCEEVHPQCKQPEQQPEQPGEHSPAPTIPLEYTYDAHGNVLTHKNSYGHWYEYTRDAYGNVMACREGESE